MSDTPRTDALCSNFAAEPMQRGMAHRWLADMTQHARELERELALFAPLNGDRTDTSLENWFPLSAEELARTKLEHANALGTAAELERKLAQSDVLYTQVLLGQRELHKEVARLRAIESSDVVKIMESIDRENEYDAYERCAKVAEDPQHHRPNMVGYEHNVAHKIAAAIRALAPSQGTPQDNGQDK